MYLDIRKGKDRRFYIMQGFRVKGGGTSTKVYMKLGKESDIKEKYGCADAEAWARQKLKEINDSIKEDKASVIVSYNPNKKDRIRPVEERALRPHGTSASVQ